MAKSFEKPKRIFTCGTSLTQEYSMYFLHSFRLPFLSGRKYQVAFVSKFCSFFFFFLLHKFGFVFVLENVSQKVLNQKTNEWNKCSKKRFSMFWHVSALMMFIFLFSLCTLFAHKTLEKTSIFVFVLIVKSTSTTATTWYENDALEQQGQADKLCPSSSPCFWFLNELWRSFEVLSTLA